MGGVPNLFGVCGCGVGKRLIGDVRIAAIDGGAENRSGGEIFARRSRRAEERRLTFVEVKGGVRREGAKLCTVEFYFGRQG